MTRKERFDRFIDYHVRHLPEVREDSALTDHATPYNSKLSLSLQFGLWNGKTV